MKKFGIFAVALAAAAVGFTSCKPKDKPIINGELANGFYVSEAGADLVAVNAMDQGKNEVDQSNRPGMYEKYVVLEANKEYEFVNKKGENADRYGSALEYGETLIVTDNTEVPGYKGSLAANTKFTVNEKALYHIVLDFNEDGNLTDVGGAQCIIVPVEWGVRGGMNGWGYTAGEKSEENDAITWTWKDQELPAAGEFKFAHSNAWKINLDIANLVKANTNLGADCVPGGDNIKVEEAGLYTITLTYKASATSSETKDCYSMTIAKTGEVVVKDYSKCELELVGDAVAEQEGAVKDASSWNWGNTLSLGLPTLAGDVYTWTRANVSLLAAGGFKVRTINAEAQGDIAAFDFGVNGENATVEADGNYTIVATVNAKSGENTLQILSADAKAITVTGVVPAEWTKCYLWAWTEAGNIFSAWPGQELEIKDGKVTYTFTPGLTGINVIFSNGDGAQTNDMTGINDDQEIDIAANLK